jgi:hypothetical protein
LGWIWLEFYEPSVPGCSYLSSVWECFQSSFLFCYILNNFCNLSNCIYLWYIMGCFDIGIYHEMTK